MFHLKHTTSGHLYHGPGGHLSVGCPTTGGVGCPCQDVVDPCSMCPSDTPTQFHVTFTGITLCTDCVRCGTDGPSAKIAGGSSINGSYVLAKNGSCGWTTAGGDVPCTVLLYSGADCTGTHVTLELAIDQQRVDANTFRLQITDAGNNILLFTADITLATCCTGYTAGNGGAGCGCAGTPSVISLGTGGTATVTRC